MSDSTPSAFPVNAANLGGPGAYPADPGMSLRDWFAGQAIPAIITATSDGNHSPGDYSGNQPLTVRMALDAYLIADAMLAAREQGK